MIELNATIPAASLFLLRADGPEAVDSATLFAQGRSVIFGVPGAFTPTCSMAHLPGYRDQAAALRAAGVDAVYGVSVNDPFVMKAWGEGQGIGDTMLLLSDGNAAFTRACGLDFDGAAFGMGVRSRRYSMLIEDGVVTALNVEPDGAFGVSSAETMLAQLQA